jgi:hypothetical protein
MKMELLWQYWQCISEASYAIIVLVLVLVCCFFFLNCNTWQSQEQMEPLSFATIIVACLLLARLAWLVLLFWLVVFSLFVVLFGGNSE